MMIIIIIMLCHVLFMYNTEFIFGQTRKQKKNSHTNGEQQVNKYKQQETKRMNKSKKNHEEWTEWGSTQYHTKAKRYTTQRQR